MYTQEIIKFLQAHILLSTTWIMLLLIIIYILINDWIYKLPYISHNNAIFLINKKNAVVIDIRDHKDYLSGYIINSINISIEKIKNNNVLKLKKFQKHPLIIVHNTGVVSNSIIQYFKKIGFEKIYILQGGIINWKTNHLPLLLKHQSFNHGTNK